jgi:hypothetical protein
MAGRPRPVAEAIGIPQIGISPRAAIISAVGIAAIIIIAIGINDATARQRPCHSGEQGDGAKHPWSVHAVLSSESCRAGIFFLHW